MFGWTFRNLVAEPLQLAASVGAAAAAFVLVMFFDAVFAGESKQIVAYARQSAADVWVMQKGVSNMHMATSFVWDWKAERVAEVEGVSKVTPILYLNTVMEAGERSWFSFVVGLEPDDPGAGPWALAEGVPQPGSGEAILPSVLAELAGVRLGDRISIAGRHFKVAGLSEGTFSMANSITFVTMADLEEIMSSFGTFSYLLVDAMPGVEGRELAARIRDEVDKVNAISKEAFIENDWEVAMQMGLEIVALMTAIGGALAVLLVGFTVHSHVTRTERELAVIKALGVRNTTICVSVTVQALSIAGLAYVLAAVLMTIAVPLTAALAPMVTLMVTAEALGRVALVAMTVAVLAAALAVRRLLRVDPMTAFQS